MVHSLYINLENIFEWFMVNGLKSIVILLLLGEKKKKDWTLSLVKVKWKRGLPVSFCSPAFFKI